MGTPTSEVKEEPGATLKRGFKTFSVGIDDRLDRVLDELKDGLGKPSRAEVFRLAVTLLKMAYDAREEGLKLTFVDKSNKIQKEVLIPG